jgi:mono/diheme cytochrome c family protein
MTDNTRWASFNMNAWGLVATATLVVASALVTVDATMQAQPSSASWDYQVFCASCHGAEGRGDGVIAKSLRKHPTDLTQLTIGNDGVFPKERVFKAIDGRQPGSAHSSADMPAWAEVFAKSNDSTGEENAAARIDVLVKYIQTLQAK